MGVPVVTLAGHSHAGRVGMSLMTAVGLEHLAAADLDGYVARAAGLASNPAHLLALRATLRERVRSSPLCDGAAFVRRVEHQYRVMWQRWCEQSLPATAQVWSGAGGRSTVAD